MTTTKGPRLWVLLVGLHDQSQAFAGDIAGWEQQIRKMNPQAIVFSMNNPAHGEEQLRPFGVRKNFDRAVQTMAQQMETGDKALVFLVSHGNVNVLANSAGSQNYEHWTGAEINQSLALLVPHETGIIISACFSGSLIPALKHPRRWILTAAAANRNSFGCDFFNKQTFFTEALLQQQSSVNLSLSTWFSRTNQVIREKESAMKLTPSSNPQLWLGPMVQSRATSSMASFWLPLSVNEKPDN